MLEDISIHEALPLSPDTDRVAQIVLTPDAAGASFQYFSREISEEQQNAWRLHANGRMRYQQINDAPASTSLEELRARLSETMPVEAYYEHLATVGADYGPAFHGIEEIRRTDGEALGRIKLPESILGEAGKYSIHPALLDACFQLIGTAVPGAADLDRTENDIIYVPVGIQRIQVFGTGEGAVHCHVQLRPAEGSTSKTLTGDLSIYDPAGNVIAVVNGLLPADQSGNVAAGSAGQRGPLAL
jgi:acyl transferase domain-containing protein